MNSKETGEETWIERAEEEKALEATVDHERLARLVGEANYPPVRSPAPKGPATSASAPAVPKQSPSWTLIIVLAVVVGALTLVVAILVRRYSSGTLYSAPPTVGHRNDNYNRSEPSPREPTITRRAMVFIPGGTFLMGSNDGPPQEAPAHAVTVNDFFMDNVEVTNAEYLEFVRETNHVFPAHWYGAIPTALPPYGTEQWPVVNVSLDDAQAFAAWRSKRDGVSYRLPTEEEWEYAARNGAQANLYPWGNGWADDRAVVNISTPQEVGSRPNGSNRWGVFDLIGNAWEWTSSKSSVYPGNPNVVPSQFKDWCVIRGGSFASQEYSRDRRLSATYRDWLTPSTKAPQLGFRLVTQGR